MMRPIRLGLLLVAATLLVGAAHANSTNPPLERTGAPDEGNCSQCHMGTALNGGGGEITIDGPLVYEPGETYELEVRIIDPSATRWGFQLTVLDTANDMAVGTLTATASGTATAVSGGRQYLRQTNAPNASETFAWLFEWTAPSEGAGDVIFYAAGNAANGFGMTGDHIYTSSTVVPSDVDGDGISDSAEIAGGTDPNDPNDPAKVPSLAPAPLGALGTLLLTLGVAFLGLHRRTPRP